MSFRVYRWDDAEAPVLDTSKGSFINVLEKCLVTGYGSGDQVTDPPDPAWQVEKSADGLHAVFWSTAADATGHYFYVRDDGEVDGDPQLDNVKDHGREAYLQGATDFTGWDENGRPQLSGVFPQPADLARGAAFQKKRYDDHTHPGAWVVIADRKTVYWFVGNYGYDDDRSANFADAANAGNSPMRAFGDVRDVISAGAVSMVAASNAYNSNTYYQGNNGSLLDNESFSGQVCSYPGDSGLPGRRIRRFRGDSQYCQNTNGSVRPSGLDDLGTATLYEIPHYLCMTGRVSGLWAMRGVVEPSLQFDGRTSEVEHLYYQLIGTADGDPLLATVGLSGHERFLVVADTESLDRAAVFFDLEDDQ